jgi:hypothetical protein
MAGGADKKVLCAKAANAGKSQWKRELLYDQLLVDGLSIYRQPE